MDAENERADKQNLDRWLDAALQARIDAEPRMGLENRVLARLAAERLRRTFIFWPIFAAVATGLVVSVTLTTMHLVEKPEVKTARTAPPSPAAEPPAIHVRSAAQEPVQVLKRHGAPDARFASTAGQQQQLPKLSTFPASRPPTAEERLLLRLAARQGSYEVATTSEDLVPLKDLSVPELTVKPLEGTPPDNFPQD